MMNEETGLGLDKLGNQHAKTEERSCSRSYNSSVDRVSTNVGPKRSISPKIGPVRRISRSPCRITMPRPNFCRQKLPPKPSPRRMSSSPGRRMSSSSSSLADHSMRRSCKPDQSKMSAEPIRSVSPSLSGRKVSRPDHCRSSSKSYPRRLSPSPCLDRKRSPRASASRLTSPLYGSIKRSFQSPSRRGRSSPRSRRWISPSKMSLNLGRRMSQSPRRSSSNLSGPKSLSPSRRKSRSPKPGTIKMKFPRPAHTSRMSPRLNTHEIMSPQNCSSNGMGFLQDLLPIE